MKLILACALVALCAIGVSIVAIYVRVGWTAINHDRRARMRSLRDERWERHIEDLHLQQTQSRSQK